MDRETYDLIARHILSARNLGTVEPREFSDWAILELERGFESKSLVMLASECDAKSYWEVERHFRDSIAELGWNFPEDQSAIERFADSTIQKIVDKEIAPMDGCRSLSDMCIYLDYPKELSNWSALYWAKGDIGDEELDRLIVDEASRRLAGEDTETINEGFISIRARSEQSPSFWQRLRGLTG